MSRIYSQRNRDKQKRQIKELQELKANLEGEQDELIETRKNFKRRLADMEVENEALRRQLIEQKERDVRLLEQRNLAQRQQLREELLMSEPDRPVMGQGLQIRSMGSGGLMSGFGVGMGGRVGSLHQGLPPPVYPEVFPPVRWPPSHFASSPTRPYRSVAPSLPDYYPPNLTQPSPPSMPGTSLPSAASPTTMTDQSQRSQQLPVYHGDTTTMAALRQQNMLLTSRRRGFDGSTHDEKEPDAGPSSRKRSKRKKVEK